MVQGGMEAMLGPSACFATTHDAVRGLVRQANAKAAGGDDDQEDAPDDDDADEGRNAAMGKVGALLSLANPILGVGITCC